jgi:hypothetical protein
MDGGGAWQDNVFVERFWRTGKCDRLCLRMHSGVSSSARTLLSTSIGITAGMVIQVWGRQTTNQAWLVGLAGMKKVI